MIDLPPAGPGAGPLAPLPPPASEPGGLEHPLAPLRDVPGVAGSFVVSDLGRLLARDMPSVFGDDVLGEVGPRALRLRDTLGYSGDEMDSAVIRYADYLLFLRPLSDGVLCALTSQDTNAPAVKMAMSLTARRLEGRGSFPAPASPNTTMAALLRGPASEPRGFPGRSRGYGF